MKKIISCIVIFCLSGTFNLNAQTFQDTTHYSLQEAEKIFLKNNLSLLASKFNIDANKALISQARLWDNPLITTDQNIYDKQGGFFKHDDNNGQFYLQVMQLIKTAGKRSKAARLATDNTRLSEAQFADMLRSLRYALRNDLIEISHLLKIKRVYDGEINEVHKLSRGMDLQLNAGNISVKDNLRIKALLFSLENELVNVTIQLMPIESELRMLLNNNDTSFIAPQFEYKFSELTTIGIPSREELIKQAQMTRPDAKMSEIQLELQQHNLIYQKALAKPDISIGSEFDQHSSYAPDYIGLAISFPLNIFNHNQGNISSARYAIQQQKALADQTQLRIRTDIIAALDKLNFFQRVNNLQQLDFSTQYDNLFLNMLKSYQDRQLSLLEFIDFMDSYKDTKLKLIEQHNGLIHSIEDLNYSVGNEVIRLN